MARRGLGPFPIPDGYLTLYEAHIRILGRPPQGAEYRDWARKGYALWTDVNAALLLDELVSYAMLRGVGLAPLSVEFWSIAKRTEGPPGTMEYGWGDKLEPLVKESDLPKLAAIWSRNPLGGAKDADVEPSPVADPLEGAGEEKGIASTDTPRSDPASTPIEQTSQPTSKPVRRSRTSEYALELIGKAFPDGWPKPGEDKPGNIVRKVVAQAVKGDKRPIPGDDTILRRLGWRA